MKYILILADGASDLPIDELEGKTPLQAAHTPNIDALTVKSRCGRLITIPPDMPPGSEVANLSVMGYDVKKAFEGRGVLEAASMGVKISGDEMAMRCNIICIENEKIKNHSAGHIETHEARILIEELQQKLNSDRVKFYPGVSYRHLLVVKGGNKSLVCTPPHDVPGKPFKELMVKAETEEGRETAELLNNLIVSSHEILAKHPVNLERIRKGQDPANSIWPWSPGYRPQMKTFMELYGKTGAVISEVDLIFGIGAYAGLKAIHVEGATGLYNTNYEGMAKAAVDALKEVDFVYLHIEASDEAGHEGDFELKKKTIEYLDYRVVRYIVEQTAAMDEPVAIAILPDHPTPCKLRTHTHDPVPFLIYHPGYKPDKVTRWNEDSVLEGGFGLMYAKDFMKTFLAD